MKLLCQTNKRHPSQYKETDNTKLLYFLITQEMNQTIAIIMYDPSRYLNHSVIYTPTCKYIHSEFLNI